MDVGVRVGQRRKGVAAKSLDMVKLELDQVVMRRMKEGDIEMVKALIKVCTTQPINFVVYS